LIAAGEDEIEADGSVCLQGEVAFVTEEMEFRPHDGQMVQTIKTTVLDDNGTTSSKAVSAHAIN
jgi:hypothetical protein